MFLHAITIYTYILHSCNHIHTIYVTMHTFFFVLTYIHTYIEYIQFIHSNRTCIVVHWEQTYFCGPFGAAYILEQFVRQAMTIPTKPIVVFSESSTGHWWVTLPYLCICMYVCMYMLCMFFMYVYSSICINIFTAYYVCLYEYIYIMYVFMHLCVMYVYMYSMYSMYINIFM